MKLRLPRRRWAVQVDLTDRAGWHTRDVLPDRYWTRKRAVIAAAFEFARLEINPKTRGASRVIPVRVDQ